VTDLRAALEAAYWDHWRRSLRDNPRDGLPAFLDRLEEVVREQAPGPIAPARDLTDEELAGLRARWRAIWEREQGQPVAGQHPPDGVVKVTGTAPTERAATPAKPATTRRRTAK